MASAVYGMEQASYNPRFDSANRTAKTRAAKRHRVSSKEDETTPEGSPEGAEKAASPPAPRSRSVQSGNMENMPPISAAAVRMSIEDSSGDTTVGESVMDEDAPPTHVPDDMVSSVSATSVVATKMQATNPKALAKALRAVLARWKKLTQAQQLAAASIDDGLLEGHVLMSGVEQQTFDSVLEHLEGAGAPRLSWFKNAAGEGCIIIDRVPLYAHETTIGALATEVGFQVGLAGGGAAKDKICDVGATKYTVPGYSSREGDGGFFGKGAAPNGTQKQPTVVIEVHVSETRSHGRNKLNHWFALPHTQHVICIWVRTKAYVRAGGVPRCRFPSWPAAGQNAHPADADNVPAGECPVLVYHYIRLRAGTSIPPGGTAVPNVPGCYLAPPLATPSGPIRFPVDIGSHWRTRLQPAAVPGRGEFVLQIPSADVFSNVPTGVPAGFPANVEMDLFFVYNALRNATDPVIPGII